MILPAVSQQAVGVGGKRTPCAGLPEEVQSMCGYPLRRRPRTLETCRPRDVLCDLEEAPVPLNQEGTTEMEMKDSGMKDSGMTDADMTGMKETTGTHH